MRVTTNGLTFNGDTAAANALDDYEEGTWTPVLADAGTGGNLATFTAASTNYTKIGNVVTVTGGLIDLTTTGMTAANPLRCRGLPFTSSSANDTTGAAFISSIVLQGTRTNVNARLSGSTTNLIFTQYGTNISTTALDCGDLTSGAADIFFTITYFV
jgi:3,4-dihydroxy-2-butanone 4-phosphate synthase